MLTRLGAGDLLYWPTTTYSTEEVARRLANVPLTGGFRERYAYDNILYGVAQLVIEKASAMSYERFLQSRIFAPLGMDDTRFNSDTLQARAIAGRHALADLRTKWFRAWRGRPCRGPAGLFIVHDLSKWGRCTRPVRFPSAAGNPPGDCSAKSARTRCGLC